MFINFNACSWLLSFSSWSLPSLFLAFTCTKREYCLCIQFHKPQSCSIWVHHTYLYGIYLSFQVNLYVPNSKPSNKNSVLYARISHVSTRDVCIFHARRVILKRSGLRSSLTRKWLVTGMPSPMLKSNQNNCKQNSPRTVVSWRHPLFRASHRLMLVGGGGYKIYHSIWEPPIMCVAWKISRSLGCYVDNESMPLKILFISVSKLELWHLYKSLIPSMKGLSIYFCVESSPSY